MPPTFSTLLSLLIGGTITPERGLCQPRPASFREPFIMRSNATLDFLVTCPSFQADLLEKELQGWLPKEILTQIPEGIIIEGSLEQGMSVILRSRIASRLFLKISEFNFSNLDELYQASLRFAWTRFLRADQTFRFDLSPSHDIGHLYKNPLILSLKTKDGLADHFRNKFGSRPDVGKKEADVVFGLFPALSSNDCQRMTLAIDLWGNSLSHRGYRPSNMPAPLRENLAASILLRSEWNKDSEWLLDPMCGSGTFLVEAALIKLGISPQYLFLKNQKALKDYSVFQVPYFRDIQTALNSADLSFKQLIEENTTALQETGPLEIYGSDLDPSQLEHCRSSLRPYGLENKVVLDQANALSVLPPKDVPGFVVLNPPYGERLENADQAKLMQLYHMFGENLKKNFKNSRCAIFTANAEARKEISLKTNGRFDFKNGPLDCKLLCYNLY